MEDQRDDPRLGTLAPPRQLLAPLENRAQRGRDREGPAFLVLRRPRFEPNEAAVSVDLEPGEREHLGFQGIPPTGKHVTVSFTAIVRIADGRLIEE